MIKPIVSLLGIIWLWGQYCCLGLYDIPDRRGWNKDYRCCQRG